VVLVFLKASGSPAFYPEARGSPAFYTSSPSARQPRSTSCGSADQAHRTADEGKKIEPGDGDGDGDASAYATTIHVEVVLGCVTRALDATEAAA